MEIGESVVFVNDVEGVEAGRHGRVMGLCDETVMVGCRMRERLYLVLVHAWDVLPEPMWRRLLRRRRIAQWETYRCQIGISNDNGPQVVSQNVTPAESPDGRACREEDMLDAWFDRAQQARERMPIEEEYRKMVARGIS